MKANFKTAALAFAAGIMVSAAAFAVSPTANAAGFSAPANAVAQSGVDANMITKVHRRNYRHKHNKGIKYAIKPYKAYQDCHWTNRRFYDWRSGTYYWKRVEICY